MIGEDDSQLDESRAQLLAKIGPEAFVDSAAICAFFNAIDRVADSTGTPLETEKAENTADFRSSLGINEFDSASVRA